LLNILGNVVALIVISRQQGGLVLVGLGGIGVLMLMSDEGRAQLVSMGALTLLIVAIYFVRQLVGSRKRA